MAIALLVESAVDSVISLLKAQLNANLEIVYGETDKKIDLQKIDLDRYYVAEAVLPLQAPAVFVIADRSEHDLTAQNLAKQTHDMMCVLLVEDVEIQRLVRKSWRYGRAAWLTLHDQSIDDIKVLVTEFNYSPIMHPEGGARQFRRDVTLRLQVMHYESF